MNGMHVLLPLLLLLAGACSGFRPDTVNTGTLAPCPASPNCVSSLAADNGHAIAPFVYSGPAGDALDRLAGLIGTMPRARVVRRNATYLYAEFRTKLFRFADDVEFLVDPEAGVLHVRSASRLGYSDLGVNRRRVERLRELFRKND